MNMTRAEIEAEITRLKEEVRQTNDFINDLIRGLPECRKADQQSLKLLSMNLPGRVFLDSENKTNQRICEERQKRDELKTKIDELRDRLQTLPTPLVQPRHNTTPVNAAKDAEVQAEISRLKIELQKVDDNLAEANNSLRWAMQEDAKERKALFRRHRGIFAGPIGSGAMSHADLQREVRVRKTIREYQEKRVELKTQIENLKAQLRSEPHSPPRQKLEMDWPRVTGVVKWYNEQKNFGFIAVDGGPDVFVHKSKLMESNTLHEGDKVTFKRIQSPKGFNAVDVRYATE